MGGPWSTFGRPWASKGVPGRARVNLFGGFGVSFGGLGASFFTNIVLWTRTFQYMLSELVLAGVFVGLWSSRGGLEPEKPCKFMVLSLKIKVRLKKVQGGFRESPGSICDRFWGSFGELWGHPGRP